MNAIAQIVRLVRSLEMETGRHAAHVYAASDVIRKINAELGELTKNQEPLGNVQTRVLGALLHERASLPPGVVVTTLKAID